MAAPTWAPCTVALGQLKPWAANPRLSTKAQAKRILASFAKFGQVLPVAIGPDNSVYDGHQRLSALLTVHGPDHEIDARRASRALTDDERRALVITLHAGATGAWNWDDLAGWDAAALGEWGMDAAALKQWNTDAAALAAMLEAEKPAPVDAESQIDRAEELREKWGVQTGQLWRLGEHRLICGDCTDKEVVERVMGGEKAQIVYTDPPYGVDYDGGTKVREKLAGDATTDLYNPACNMAAEFSDKHAPLYIWHAGVKGIAAAAAAAAAGYEIRCEIVWNKNQAQYGALSAQYKQKHEPCYYCFKRGNAPRWFGPTTEITVWDCDRASVNEYHPTQKPVELAERALRNSSEAGGIVLDLFLGSGATMIAAENLRRRCRAVEISPAYVAVALERWAQATGGTPELVEA